MDIEPALACAIRDLILPLHLLQDSEGIWDVLYSRPSFKSDSTLPWFHCERSPQALQPYQYTCYCGLLSQNLGWNFFSFVKLDGEYSLTLHFRGRASGIKLGLEGVIGMETSQQKPRDSVGQMTDQKMQHTDLASKYVMLGTASGF